MNQSPKSFTPPHPLQRAAKFPHRFKSLRCSTLDKPLVKQGQYLARAGDCIGGHTRPGGAPFAGGLPLKTPSGVIVATNITPDKTDGIGNYAQAQFNRLMREGVTETNHNIYPAMPHASYARLSDDDLAALCAYFYAG